MSSSNVPRGGVAIIGMSGRFPGAKSVAELWRNLREGAESISFFSDQELAAAGVDPATLKDPAYVKAKGVLQDVELFDASFFGLTPREAEFLDPQHRIFLECAWAALESAGCVPDAYAGTIGVFAGSSSSETYYLHNIYGNQDLRRAVGYQLQLSNLNDFLATRVSYLLNLKGPSVAVQTACSTSLVAVVMACQSLLSYQCDMTIAGGVSLTFPLVSGHFYREGMIFSPDGHCRAFDAQGGGTVSGNGAGLVVLKRLDDAIDDGDHIYAVIRGAAINNDGSVKLGYTAPSVGGQAEVIAHALALAEVDPDSIAYVEAHGTGTPLGDPIEITALTKAFRSGTSKKQFCAVGSIKSNIGHLDAAAGVAGLIKAVMAVKSGEIPPSLHFRNPNPEIDFENSPFYVGSSLAAWPPGALPRRAGVSSFGMGGTNAHVVLEEAPHPGVRVPSRAWQLLVLSAKTKTALDAMTKNLIEHFRAHPELDFADVACTLQTGRKAFRHRRILVCQDPDDAAVAITTLGTTRRVFTGEVDDEKRGVVFMFSGQGSQYVNMGRELYEKEPFFREQINLCAEILRPLLGLDLRVILYPEERDAERSAAELSRTELTQPALFMVEYAMARLLIKWGIQPSAMIGHSIGEYAAACLSGVLSLDDALSLVARRGQLMQQMPPGAMIAVPLPESEVLPLLTPDLTVAAVNAPSLCVVSGPTAAVEDLADTFDADGVEFTRLRTSHAFHSAMMEPILDPFVAQVKRASLGTPQIPFISNVTGTWITDAEATSPEYWARHLRQPVLFSAGVQELMREPEKIFVEIGPGRTLMTLAKQQPKTRARHAVLTSMRNVHEMQSDVGFILNTLGQLWLEGVRIDWSGFYASEKRLRAPLPSYPFERQRYWIDPIEQGAGPAGPQGERGPREPAGLFHVPSWKKSKPLAPMKAESQGAPSRRCLVLVDGSGLGAAIAERLRRSKHDVIVARAGRRFEYLDDGSYTIDPNRPEDYAAVIKDLQLTNRPPEVVLHTWGAAEIPREDPFEKRLEQAQAVGFYSLLFLAQAMVRQRMTGNVRITVVTSGVYAVTERAAAHPEKATVLGPVAVIPKEYPNISCISVDVEGGARAAGDEAALAGEICADTLERSDRTVAYRGGARWVQLFDPVNLPEEGAHPARTRARGVYLVTGGLSSVGLALAEHLAKAHRARLVLLTDLDLPPLRAGEQWQAAEGSDNQRASIAAAVRAITRLETLGAEILVVKGSCASPDDARDAVRQALDRFGELNGVIHAAGAPVVGGIQQKTKDVAESVMAPKVKGVVALESAVEGVPIDFFALCSSLGSLMGTFRQVDYCAANAFLDAYSYSRPERASGAVVTINWDTWLEPATPAERGKGPPGDALTTSSSIPPAAARGLSHEEGTSAFERILSSGLPHVVVSTQELESMLEVKSISATAGPASITDVEIDSIPKSVHPRPKLNVEYVAPRNPLERIIAEIWQKFFGIDAVGINDDFFALGGSSLLAVQLISKLRQAVNVELPSHSLLGAPTIATLADLIAQASSPPSARVSRRPLQALLSSLVKIKGGRSPQPLFLIHPVGGHVYFYRDLAQCLDPNQIVYGLQAQGVEGRVDPLDNVEEMASHYIESLRLVQPKGPYLIGGSSFGGIVAYEMAQQLDEMEDSVGLLLMMDTPSPGKTPEKLLDGPERMAYLLSGDADIASLASDAAQQLSADEQLLQILKQRGIARRTVPDLALPQLSRFRRIVKVNLEAMFKYAPRPYRGHVVFFRARDRDAFTDDSPEKGWLELVTGGIEVHEVPGNHITMNFSPQVEVVAEHIKGYMRGADGHG